MRLLSEQAPQRDVGACVWECVRVCVLAAGCDPLTLCEGLNNMQHATSPTAQLKRRWSTIRLQHDRWIHKAPQPLVQHQCLPSVLLTTTLFFLLARNFGHVSFLFIQINYSTKKKCFAAWNTKFALWSSDFVAIHDMSNFWPITTSIISVGHVSGNQWYQCVFVFSISIEQAPGRSSLQVSKTTQNKQQREKMFSLVISETINKNM